MLEAREALTAAPAAAELTWKTICSWVNGTHSRSTVETFTGLGEQHSHVTTFTFDADHPECFASEDHGASPTEYVLVALASCLTAGVAAVAQHRGIQLRTVTATVEGGGHGDASLTGSSLVGVLLRPPRSTWVRTT